MDLNKIRQDIDKIDDQIATLYGERMKLVEKVSEAKKESGKATLDAEREKSIILRVTDMVEDDKNLLFQDI